VFHPENISVGDNVYVGHNAILKGYHMGEMEIGEDTWIGQGCFLHSGGGIRIGKAVGIGPMVEVFSSFHAEVPSSKPLLWNELVFKPVIVEDGADIGVGATILPGVRIGKGSIVGAGSVVTRSVSAGIVVAGNPARVLRKRKGKGPEGRK
jgi:acetyltransferase-like isoleucine patch superfamily enzyme